MCVDATDAKVRGAGRRIVLVAVIMAVAVNAHRRREVLGMAIGSSEAETSGSSSWAGSSGAASLVSNW
jgi:transposase-like protein